MYSALLPFIHECAYVFVRLSRSPVTCLYSAQLRASAMVGMCACDRLLARSGGVRGRWPCVAAPDAMHARGLFPWCGARRVPGSVCKLRV